MAMNWVTVPTRGFQGGIDQVSAESSLRETYVEDARNIDFTSDGYMRKRKGFKVVGSFLPVPVVQYSQVTDPVEIGINATFAKIKLPEGVDLYSHKKNTPVFIKSISTLSGTDFASTTEQMYTHHIAAEFVTTFFSAYTIPATEHMHTSLDFVVVVYEWDINARIPTRIVDEARVSIDSSSLNVTITNVSNGTVIKVVFVKPLELGGYIESIDRSASITHTLTRAVHGVTSEFIPVGFVLAGGIYTQEGPLGLFSSSYIEVTAQGTVTLAPNASLSARIFLIPAVQSVVKTDDSGLFTVDLETDFPIFTEIITSTGRVVTTPGPANLVIDTVANTAEMSYATISGGKKFLFNFVKPKVRTLFVQVKVLQTSSVSTPRMFVYGLPQDTIWADNPGVDFIAPYVSVLEQYPISLWQDEFWAYSSRNPIISFQTKMTLISRNVDVILAPCFIDDGATPNRWRRQIQANGVSGGTLRGSSISYNSGTGYVDYSFEITGISEVGSGTAAIVPNLDWLTAAEASNNIHNGSFRITAYSISGDVLTISVFNPEVDKIRTTLPTINLSQFDEAQSGFLGGVLSDHIIEVRQDSWFIDQVLLPQDKLVRGDALYPVLSHNYLSNILVLDGLTSEEFIGASERLYFIREKSKFVPVNITTDLCPVEGMVLNCNGIGEFKVVHASTLNSVGVVASFFDDGERCVVTVAANRLRYIREGEEYLLVDTTNGYKSRTVTVQAIESSTTFTVTSSGYTISGSGVIAGSVIKLDRDIDVISNSLVFTWDTWWSPISAPTDSFAKTPLHTYTGLGLAEDEFSVLKAKDSTFIQSSENELLKFDGTSVYAAGLPRWQTTGMAWVELDEGTSPIPAQISISMKTSITSGSTNRIEINDTDDRGKLRVNDTIRLTLSGSTIYRTIINVDDSGSGVESYDLNEDVTAQAADFTVDKVWVYKYYARFSYIDQNSNVTISAPGQLDDLTVYRLTDKQCVLKFICFPPGGFRDYDRVLIDIYRTKANGEIPYLVERSKLSFDNDMGYYVYTETTYDNELIGGTEESYPALESTILQTGIVPPPKGAAALSLENSIVIGNLAEPQNLEIQLVKTQALSVSSLAGAILSFTDGTNTQGFEFTSSASAITSLVKVGTAGGAGYLEIQDGGISFAAGEWVYIFMKDSTPNPQNTATQYCGWYQLEAGTSAVVGRVYVPNLLADPQPSGLYIAKATGTNVPVYIARDDLSMAPTSQADTIASLQFMAMLRLSMTINAYSTMRRGRNVPIWLSAFAGNSFESGFIRVETASSTLSMTMPSSTYFDDMKWFVNGIQRSAAETVASRARYFPSRIARSKANFPEVFDSCYLPDTVAVQVNDIMDINPTDGQTITAISSAFGESVSGESRQSTAIAVFKEESIYLVDFERRLQVRIESGRLGCTAPRSVASTKQGVMFANNSGIYRLDAGRSVVWAGRAIDRIWREAVDRSRLSEIVGIHDPSTRSYRLSVPFLDGSWYVLTYFYDNEEQGVPGAWTIYSGMRATGWAQFADASYFCTDLGQVFQLREDGQVWDYRDDTSPIECSVTLRAEGFGDTGIRKLVKGFRIHFRNYQDMDSTAVYTAADLKNNFAEADRFQIDLPYNNTFLSDQETRKVDILKFTCNTRKLTHFQVKIENDGLDEGLEIVQVDYRVGGLSDEGTNEAKSTT